MIHLKKIKLGNFKCFSDETNLEFGKLTLLTGANSTGKSSLVYGVLGALQSPRFPYEFSANGRYINLGNFSEMVYAHDKTLMDRNLSPVHLIDDQLERDFYEKECISEGWTVDELHRQKESGLFMRLAVSKDKQGILMLAHEGQQVQTPEDVVKSTYTLEFLGIENKKRYKEKDLENKLIDNMQMFLLELGKGFTFVKRQYGLTINNLHYHIDLVFYHRILRCFVLIDMKRGAVKHKDIGQMNMYLGYFAKEENMEGDNPPIGIIMSHYKDELMVEYATYGMDSNLFVSKYELFLPNKEELRNMVRGLVGEAGTR